jgi:hypothetical protein
MDRPISFPNWKAALAQAPLGDALKAAYTREILSFLKHCKEARSAATVETAKRYLVWREKQSRGPSREALRWFYQEGRRLGSQSSDSLERPAPSPKPAEQTVLPSPTPGLLDIRRPSRPMEPPPAASDLGGAPWERDLIKAIRERGHLWRTKK